MKLIGLKQQALCKKDLKKDRISTQIIPDGGKIFKKGNYYNVEELENCYWVQNETPEFFLKFNKFDINLEETPQPKHNSSTRIFSEYFYTLKELRKQKLEKLNEK